MNMFFIEFRDPLFGIIIFFTLVFMITFFSYWLNRYKRKEDYRHLDRFLKQFNSTPSQEELKVLVSSGDLSEKSWLLLAKSYSKDGDYEKSIEIYSQLLKVGNNSNYRETLFLLGKTYFKAGFLERAKQIFLEILKNNPRTPQALNYLLLVHESMRDYESAMSVLEPLDAIGVDITTQSAYLRVLVILNDSKLSIEDRVEKLLEIDKESNQLTRLIFEYIFRVNPKLAWKNLDTSKAMKLIDVLWSLEKEDLDFDVINKNSFLKELYTAKGCIDEVSRSSVFELDILINLKSKMSATLSFEYICDSCKQVFPFGFHRCSNCHTIDSAEVELGLSKNYHKDLSEENNSFQ